MSRARAESEQEDRETRPSAVLCGDGGDKGDGRATEEEPLEEEEELLEVAFLWTVSCDFC